MSKEPSEKDRLNPRQARFVEEYLKDLCGKQAAIRAGYAAGSADVAGSRLLAQAKVKRAVEAGLAERSRRTAIDAAEILQEIRGHATVDIAAAYGPDGQLLPLDQIPERVRRSIQAIEIAKTGERVAIFVDKAGQLELLGKHLGLFKEKVELTGKDGEALTVELVCYDAQKGGG